MPLLPGKANIGHNIKAEQAAGKPHKQAVAIALKTARNSGAQIPMPHERRPSPPGAAVSERSKRIGAGVTAIEPGRARGTYASAAARRLPIINAPLFDDKTKEPGVSGKDQFREPLAGPSDRTVGNPPGEMSNLKAFEQNQAGTPDLTPSFPAPIQESDFPNKDEFSPGTAKNMKDWV